MSEPFLIALIALTVNLGGTLVIYSFMAFFLARLSWHGRGVPAVLMTIIAAELFWIVPAMIGSYYSMVGISSASYALCFGNWLVSAFAILLFCQTVKGISRQLEDSARLDGCSSFGIYRHVVLPLVRWELGFIALLTVMATAFPFWAYLTAPDGTDFRPLFEFVRLRAYDSLVSMLAVSVITSLFVAAIFLVAKGRVPVRN